MGTVIAALSSAWQIVGKLPFKEGLSATATWFLKGSPLILRVFTLTFLLFSAILVSIVWLNVSATNETMMRILASPLEASPHPNTAIEALLLASILDQPGASSRQSTTTTSSPQADPAPSPQFTSSLNDIQEAVNNAIRAHAPSTALGLPKNSTPKSESIDLDILNNDGRNTISTEIASDEFDGFLFIPGALLDGVPGAASEKPLHLNSLVQPRLFLDVRITQEISQALCSSLKDNFASDGQGSSAIFASAPSGISAKYLQAYLILRSGVTRICEAEKPSGWIKQREYYKAKFPPNTYLQQRPYFDLTVEAKNGTKVYWSKPYVDLGGNGVIQTLCRYISAHNEDGVVCFDFPVQPDITDAIKSQVSTIGGSVTEFNCGGESCEETNAGDAESPTFRPAASFFFPSSRLTSDERSSIQKQYAGLASSNEKAKFTGNISFPTNIALPPSVIILIVPVGSDKILAVKLDLGSYQRWRSLWLILAATCVVVTVALLMLMFVDYGLKFKEQERAFNAVDTIMTDVPAPYARVDEDGRFVKINDSFARLVGYSSAVEALPELSRYTYEQFLADETSVQTYAKIKEERQTGAPYRSYLVKLWANRKPGIAPIVDVKVHGGDVPTPHAARNKPGQSFGILLKTDPPKPIAVVAKRGEDEITEPLTSSGG